jgi:LmbE family N-acetylglucosaminyl deacetylase
LARGVVAGERVVCVSATRGELGTDDPERFPPEKLARIRTDELDACMATLGVTEHHWLDYPDGGCGDIDPAEPVARLVQLLEDLRPATVLTFGPEGMTDHVDHKAVSRWTAAAVQQAGLVGTSLYYATHTPEWAARWNEAAVEANVMMSEEAQPPVTPHEELAIDFLAQGDALDRKERALRCMDSQVGPMLEILGAEGFRTLIGEEVFRYP